MYTTAVVFAYHGSRLAVLNLVVVLRVCVHTHFTLRLCVHHPISNWTEIGPSCGAQTGKYKTLYL